MGAAKIVVVDDNPQLRRSLVVLLSEAGFDVIEAEDGRECVRLVGANDVDLVLLDVNMPVLGGYEVCQRLRQARGLAIGIVFLSGSRTEPFDRAAGLDIGADDYMTKPYDPTELLARIRATLRRVEAHNAQLPRPHPLTPRQLEVLVLLARGASPSDVARQLFLSPATVSKHIERILRVLGVRSRAEAVAWAYRRGIVEQDDRQPLDVSGQVWGV
jgi:DNA-binding NarL/FixJ family response regulator